MSRSLLGDWLARMTIGGLTTGGGISSGVDMVFRRALVLSKLFTKSWGHPNTLKQLASHRRKVMSRREINNIIAEINPEIVIEKEMVKNGIRSVEGRFRSPHAVLFPEQMEGPVQWAHFRGHFPTKRKQGLCIHLAGTGDHSYFRREFGIANDLLEKDGTAAILLQNPFYTDRKPPQQFRSSLENVSDLFVMGAALMSECNFLLQWAAEEGYTPLAISGISMGGYMTALAASNSIRPIAVVPCLSWTTAGPPYTEGAIAAAINYPELQKQIEDPQYINKLKAIPDTTWVDEMHEQNERNKRGLAYNLMRILMDEFTSLANYPVPLDTSLCNSVIAAKDAYIIRDHGAPDFRNVWPGMRIDELTDVGHVQAYVYHQSEFRKAIRRMMKAAHDKYPPK